jgi:hypothetical protein
MVAVSNALRFLDNSPIKGRTGKGKPFERVVIHCQLAAR